MKTKLFLITVIMLAYVSTNAQETPAFAKGNNIINLGVGFGSTLYHGVGYKNSVPPISISFEHIMKDGLMEGKAGWGLGGYLGYTSAKWEYTYIDPFSPQNNFTYGWKYTSLIIGPRGTLHYHLAPKFDTYVGVLLGYNVVTAKETGSYPYWYYQEYTSKGSDVAWAFFAGGRYYVSSKLAVMAEVGYGIAYLNLGIALKM